MSEHVPSKRIILVRFLCQEAMVVVYPRACFFYVLLGIEWNDLFVRSDSPLINVCFPERGESLPIIIIAHKNLTQFLTSNTYLQIL
jgi:hypothetical protein